MRLLGSATLTRTLQFRLPKAAGEFIGVGPGDKVVLTPRSDGSILIRRATTADLAALPYRGKRKEAGR